jgi:hypothetical protein
MSDGCALTVWRPTPTIPPAVGQENGDRPLGWADVLNASIWTVHSGRCILDIGAMARKKRIAAIALLISATTLVTVVVGSVYVAMGRVRPFYAEALQLDPQRLETGSRELESRATALYSETRQPGEWRAAFTAEQINGWLAMQLADVYADALPKEISDPRVAITDDHLTIGFRTRRGGVDTVISADAAVMLTDEGDVAIRLLAVHAGALPLPVMQVADDVSRACQELSLPVRWTQVDGQPVAIVDVDHHTNVTKAHMVLEAVELRDGAIYLAGHTAAEVAGGEATSP